MIRPRSSLNESNDLYGETLNGVQVNNAKKNQFLNRIDPFLVSGDPSSGLLPGISNWTPSLDGRADDKIQAYNFRLCLTRIEDNQILFSMPEGYDPKLYELLLRTLNRGSRHIFAHFHPIPNSKTDTNNYGSFSTNFIGMNYGYPEGTYEKRREIVKEHENYLRGYFYFLTHDSRVPQDVRDGMSQWGLARDEFTSNRYWPEQIYVREARRMLGRFVMTEHEVAGRKTARRSIGMGLCNINSHNVQRYVSIDENGVSYVLNEGDFEFEVRQPYKISFDSLLPKRQECENLLVPVCLSASHVAFGSLREEAVFMILGQSAATAAALAVQKDVSLHELSYAELRENLLRDGQVLELKKLDRVKSGEGIPLISLGGVVVDGAMVELEGDWTESTSMRPFVGKSYFHDGNGNKGMCTAKFPFVAPMNGLHEIKVSFSSFGNRAGNLNYLINHEKGFSKVPVDQRKPQSIDDLWFSLGSFEFVKGKQYCVSLSNENTEGYVVADAIQVISLLSDPVQE